MKKGRVCSACQAITPYHKPTCKRCGKTLEYIPIKDAKEYEEEEFYSGEFHPYQKEKESDTIDLTIDANKAKRYKDHITHVSRKEQQPNRIIIVDIKMPFGSMVEFMVKWVLASIPAFIILTILLM